MAYVSAYLCRTNLSIVLPSMKDTFEWNNALVGLIGTAFFWCYAVGQLINGSIGDKVNPRYFIPIGLIGSSIINFLIGIFPNIYFILIVWSINGFLLSTIWGPIIRITAAWFPTKERTKVAVGLNLSMMGGYLLSWGLVGVIINYTSWRWGFFLPALFTFCYAIIFLVFMRAKPREVGGEDYSQSIVNKESIECNQSLKENQMDNLSLFQLIKKERLWLIAIACISQGVIKEGIALWTPTFLKDNYHVSQTQISLVSTFVPLVGIAGIFLAGWLNARYKERERKPLTILLIMAIISCFTLYYVIGNNIYLDVILLSLSSAIMYGINMLLLTMVPLSYARYNKASGVTGFLDFCSYLGAGLSGVLTGFIVDLFGWSIIMVFWSILAFIGIIAVSRGFSKKDRSRNELCRNT